MPTSNPQQFHREGSIEFYFTNEDVPDRVIENISIIQAAPQEFGTTQTMRDVPDDPDNPDGLSHQEPTTVKRAVISELWFADFRHRFQPPRGGRLFQGEINGKDTAEEDLIPNSELIKKCLAALGLTAEVPGPWPYTPEADGSQEGTSLMLGVDGIAPMRKTTGICRCAAS